MLPVSFQSISHLLLCAANRVMQAMFMLLEAKRWIERELPWWSRKQGRDHIWYRAVFLALHASVCSIMNLKGPFSVISAAGV